MIPLSPSREHVRYCLDPTVEQSDVLARHAGAARFAFNQSLHFVRTALDRRKTTPQHPVPWTRFDLINAFNTWKKTEAAGRVFAVSPDGVAEIEVTGLAWRTQVCQQVFEEAADGTEVARIVTVAIADQWYPSSKRCSACATINPTLTLADRTFFCGCGFRAGDDRPGRV
ncbi:helix-turn-helix domain-containing protein, partial [Streptomyces anulatus]|uniref:helix-turn-helix domain-containing protein n=1 Tax=Streptomyces anulatus TaxID=1892 RepID=UPI0036A7E622